MTALIGYFSRQFNCTAHSTRRLRWLMVLLSAIAAAGVLLMVQRYPKAIEYPKRYITATPAAVCPGETFTYPVVIKIDQSDAASTITEVWCNAKTGICPRVYQSPQSHAVFLEPYSVSTPATRTVPLDMPPGDWQLRHSNETHSNGKISVVVYQVDVTVKDCAAPEK